MHTFAQKPKATQQTKPTKSTKPNRVFLGQSRAVSEGWNLQRTIGNQIVKRLLQTNADEREVGLVSTASPRFAHDFSQMPLHAKFRPKNQPKLTISTPGDIHEQEADHVANQLMSMPSLQQQRVCACGGGCPKCEAEQVSHQPQLLQKLRVRENDGGETTASPMVYDVLRSPGQPLDSATKAYFEPLFGHDFGRVRVHVDSKAAESARIINAAAYTAGSHIVFGAGNFPGKDALTAHELTHVIQQTTHAHQLSNKIQRQVITPVGPSLSWPVITSQLACLNSLIDEMSRQTRWYLRTACSDGNYLTSLSGLRYIPEDRADAFGHCWIACQGAKTCGEEATRAFGESREIFREVMKYLTFGVWGHNSYEEDTFNQRHGRELARNNPDGDCSSLCYQAILSDALRFHGHHTGNDPARPRVYNCSDIIINGNEYRQGWRNIPLEHLWRF